MWSRTDGTEIVTEVAHGGTLGEHKGINAPDVQFPSSLTEKDVQAINLGIALGVDLVAVLRPDRVRSSRWRKPLSTRREARRGCRH